jgi:hypothetical protein
MTLLGSQDTGLGNVDTAGQPPAGTGGSIVEVTSPDGSVTIANPTGPDVQLEVPAAQPPASAVAGLAFPLVAGVPTLTASDPVTFPGLAVTGVETLNGDNVATVPSNAIAGAIATWGGVGSVRFFACDGTAGNDANAGFSDVSQAAAGLVAVKTLARLFHILPKFGAGRSAQVAIRSGNYASDTILDLSQISGYSFITITATDTVASAGAVAFSGSAGDQIAAGMTTGTGLNAAGYNVTSYTVAADGTVTATLQLNGGGAPAFGAMPARPYRCRLRGDVATTTVALRNATAMVIAVPTTNTVILNLALPTAPALGDVFYLEQPNVTGPTSTLMHHTGSEGLGFQLVGLTLGAVQATHAFVRFSGCEAGSFICTSSDISCTETAFEAGYSSTPQIGTGLAVTRFTASGGNLTLVSFANNNTGLITLTEPQSIVAERFGSGAQIIVYGGAHAVGNNIAEEIGTNSSTNHGSTAQIWGNIASGAAPLRCGLYLSGGANIGRIKFSNMGANPCVRVNGSGLGVCLQGISGGVADGNTDVGLDLSPSGLSGNTIGAMGCNVALVGSPAATGSNGDVRLSDGSIVSWATATAGIADANNNKIFGAGNGPDHPTAVATGAGVLAVTNAPAGATTYARYFKMPDGAGGFYTVGSLT